MSPATNIVKYSEGNNLHSFVSLIPLVNKTIQIALLF